MCTFQHISITAGAALMFATFAVFIAPPALAQAPSKPSDCDWIEVSPSAIRAGHLECPVYRQPVGSSLFGSSLSR